MFFIPRTLLPPLDGLVLRCDRPLFRSAYVDRARVCISEYEGIVSKPTRAVHAWCVVVVVVVVVVCAKV